MTTLARISTSIKRWPLLFRLLRRVFYGLLRLRVALAAWQNGIAMLGKRSVSDAGVENGQSSFRLPTMHEVASGNGWKAAAVGANASGRDVVMLVVSDLRIDPRVEREARALASAGYGVTVICPEPSDGAGQTYNLDWGAGVSIKFVHWTCASFMNDQPGYNADLLYWEAVKQKPFAFHAHDLSTAYAGLAAAKFTGAHLVVDFHEWFSENVHWDRDLPIHPF